MGVKPILKMGHPVLSQVAEAVQDPRASEIRELVQDMQASMKEVGGVGLAAPQIGDSRQVVIYEVPAARMRAEDGDEATGINQTTLINPVLTPLGEEKAFGWEGCLSVPGLRGLVPRFTRISYSAVDMDGKKIEGEAVGFHARVLQHECDHLLGILYPQRMTDMRCLVYESEMSAFMADFDPKSLVLE